MACGGNNSTQGKILTKANYSIVKLYRHPHPVYSFTYLTGILRHAREYFIFTEVSSIMVNP